VFAINGTADACEAVRRAGFDAHLLDRPLDALAAHYQPDLLILDCREGPTRFQLAKVSGKVGVVAVIDDASERRLAADVAYYPPVPQAFALDWSSSRCEPRIGWEWSLLGANTVASPAPVPSGRPTLLVTMGGSDPFGLTLLCARALTTLDPVFRARFVIGPGVADRDLVARQILSLSENFETVERADDLATEYAGADLALAAFGVTAYELAAFGVPALYLCLNEDHAQSASAFERAGIGNSLGLAETVSGETIASNARLLMSDSCRRREMHAAGLMTIDGEGPARVATDLAKTLADRRALIRAAL
jgi:spore coat polysaccharide biosynthesis protein SpsF